MNVGIGTEAAQFVFWEFVNWIFRAVWNVRQKSTIVTVCVLCGYNQGEGVILL